MPESLIVLGGGPVGAELSQVLARFGARVTIIETQPRLLPAAEPEAGDLLAGVFAREGIDVRTGTPAAAVSHDGRQFTVRLDGETITAGRLLVAAGRRTRLAELGAAALGLDPAARTVTVGERMRAAAGLWAIGDVTGVSAHTHVAMYQADIAVRDILGTGGPGADYRPVPAVTFTDPEIGQAGLTEAQAASSGSTCGPGSPRYRPRRAAGSESASRYGRARSGKASHYAGTRGARQVPIPSYRVFPPGRLGA